MSSGGVGGLVDGGIELLESTSLLLDWACTWRVRTPKTKARAVRTCVVWWCGVVSLEAGARGLWISTCMISEYTQDLPEVVPSRQGRYCGFALRYLPLRGTTSVA